MRQWRSILIYLIIFLTVEVSIAVERIIDPAVLVKISASTERVSKASKAKKSSRSKGSKASKRGKDSVVTSWQPQWEETPTVTQITFPVAPNSNEGSPIHQIKFPSLVSIEDRPPNKVVSQPVDRPSREQVSQPATTGEDKLEMASTTGTMTEQAEGGAKKASVSQGTEQDTTFEAAQDELTDSSGTTLEGTGSSVITLAVIGVVMVLAIAKGFSYNKNLAELDAETVDEPRPSDVTIFSIVDLHQTQGRFTGYSDV